MATPVQQFEWLVKEGLVILQEFADTDPSEAWRDRANLNAWQAALIREQLSLRRRARKRFPDPERWLFTDRSLSQASDWWSADFKSRVWPLDEKVTDVCCGAGVDLTAIARFTTAEGIDYDEPLLMLTNANLNLHRCKAKTSCREADLGFLSGIDGRAWFHADPDRRPEGKKVLSADSFSPSLDWLLEAASRSAGAMIKVAPATRFSEATSDRVDASATRVWLGVLGECRQQLLLLRGAQEQFKALMPASAAGISSFDRCAILLIPQPSCNSLSMIGESVVECFSADHHETNSAFDGSNLSPGVYVYDLHSALYASGLHVAWAEQHALQPVSNAQGFYWSDQHVQTPWAQAFEIMDVVAWDDRKVRKLLRRFDAGLVEVKTRLVKMDATAFQRRYSSKAGVPYSLLVTRIGNRVRCMVTRRLPSTLSG